MRCEACEDREIKFYPLNTQSDHAVEAKAESYLSSSKSSSSTALTYQALVRAERRVAEQATLRAEAERSHAAAERARAEFAEKMALLFVQGTSIFPRAPPQ